MVILLLALVVMSFESVRSIATLVLTVRGLLAIYRDLATCHNNPVSFASMAPLPPPVDGSLAIVKTQPTVTGEVVVSSQVIKMVAGVVGATLRACREIVIDEVIAIDAHIRARRMVSTTVPTAVPLVHVQ